MQARPCARASAQALHRHVAEPQQAGGAAAEQPLPRAPGLPAKATTTRCGASKDSLVAASTDDDTPRITRSEPDAQVLAIPVTLAGHLGMPAPHVGRAHFWDIPAIRALDAFASLSHPAAKCGPKSLRYRTE